MSIAIRDSAFASLPEDLRALLRRYLKHLGGCFEEDLSAIVLYGSGAGADFLPDRSNVNVLVLLARHGPDRLRKYADLHRKWKKEQIVSLILTGDELKASYAQFPLEYQDMADTHLVLAGEDPFTEPAVDAHVLIQACRRELRAQLIRLRQRFVEGGGTVEAVLMLLPLSLTATMPALRGWVRVQGKPVRRTAEAVIQDMQMLSGVDLSAFGEVLQLKKGQIGPGPAEAPRLYDRYVASLEGLVRAVE
jgi:hypothetical protein